MKYYLVKHRNGLFAYRDNARYYGYIDRIETFRISDDCFFDKYYGCGFKKIMMKQGLILFKSDNLNEIVERAALEAL